MSIEDRDWYRERASPRNANEGRLPFWTFWRSLLFWVVAMSVLVVIFSQLGGRRTAKQTVVRTGQQMQLTVPMALDGHYYVNGSINGKPVRFMVDTGATYVAVSETLAARLGIPRGRAASFNTAAGTVQGSLSREQLVAIDDFSSGSLSVGILPGGPELAVLGQNYLRHVTVIQANRQLTLQGGQAQ